MKWGYESKIVAHLCSKRKYFDPPKKAKNNNYNFLRCGSNGPGDSFLKEKTISYCFEL